MKSNASANICFLSSHRLPAVIGMFLCIAAALAGFLALNSSLSEANASGWHDGALQVTSNVLPVLTSPEVQTVAKASPIAQLVIALVVGAMGVWQAFLHRSVAKLNTASSPAPPPPPPRAPRVPTRTRSSLPTALVL